MDFEHKVWNGIAALTSGVLTSLVYDALSNISYAVTVDADGGYTVSQLPGNVYTGIALMLVIFAALWFLISVLAPLAAAYVRSLTFPAIKAPTGRGLVKVLDTAKADAEALYQCFYISQDPDLILLRARDLCQVVAALHKNFIPKNASMQRYVQKFFRVPEHATIINMEHSVSSYEFSALVHLLARIAGSASEAARGNALLKRDCTEMKEMLKDLERLVKR